MESYPDLQLLRVEVINYNYIREIHYKSFFDMQSIHIIIQLTHVTSTHKPTSSTSYATSYCILHKL
jgi:hypothetical protein